MSYRFNDISKLFNGTRVLDDVNLEIPAATIRFLTGRSGSGKTTLLKILAGLEPYQDNTGKSSYIRDNSITYVPQVNSLWNNLTVGDNITLYRRLQMKETAEEAAANSKWLADILGISDKFNRFPSKLSAGEHQRVAIARALASDKKLILLDEITANLDFENKAYIRKVIEQSVDKGISFLLISHDLDFISQFSPDCLVIENANLVTKPIKTYAED